MAMVYLFLKLLFLLEILSAAAASPTACSYTSLTGASQAVSYDAATDKSVEYVDYGTNTNGICVQRARCSKEFVTQVIKCSDLRITCENRKLFEGEFPACCVKC
ncbi:PREDICTED: uncharacterized protein LOC108366714 [Rhagoletis zephyria]|uniref:uncharacterized protein LOC108366714 n=1 Tax=Rhagoletis zephyria TaxID=28612 RepID=UPI0008114F88|nr:PREDICTED: uncharacterized protein LOC108366714 [Rhagoletis zephyria]